MIEDKDIIGEYEVVKNLALIHGIPSSRIHYEQADENLLFLIIECHDLLKLYMYYDIEWTIEYHYSNGVNHNHILDFQRDEYMNKLFKGEIFLLIDKRFRKRIGLNKFKFVSKENVDKTKSRYMRKKKVKLFSTREILIDN